MATARVMCQDEDKNSQANHQSEIEQARMLVEIDCFPKPCMVVLPNQRRSSCILEISRKLSCILCRRASGGCLCRSFDITN